LLRPLPLLERAEILTISKEPHEAIGTCRAYSSIYILLCS
ncbi:MAG: hypothetical protein RL001_297, partial [Pseudomonadota bacterium]